MTQFREEPRPLYAAQSHLRLFHSRLDSIDTLTVEPVVAFDLDIDPDAPAELSAPERASRAALPWAFKLTLAGVAV